MQTRPVWAEIRLDRLVRNYRLLRTLAGDAGLIAVVKADAYGHGALACAAALDAAGAPWLGVTSVEEGVAVRSVCPNPRILVMGGIWRHEAEAVIEHRLTSVVWEPAHLEWLQAAALKRRLPPRSAAVHLEVDTGMARQGVRLDKLPALLDQLHAAESLSLEAVMTHFHSPEILDGGATAQQLARFDSSLKRIVSAGLHPSIIHAGNSATVLACPQSITDLAAKYGATAMLRPGLALYGYAPRFTGNGASAASDELEPVLAWKTRVVSLRTIEPGESAGYCATFHAQRESRLALLPVGYADGLNRLLSNRGEVLVRGQRAPIAGRISMDLTIIDVTNVDGVELGDEVALIGDQKSRDQGSGISDRRERGRQRITAYELADLVNTIPYEVLCNISGRVPRVTKESNEDHG